MKVILACSTSLLSPNLCAGLAAFNNKVFIPEIWRWRHHWTVHPYLILTLAISVYLLFNFQAGESRKVHFSHLNADGIQTQSNIR